MLKLFKPRPAEKAGRALYVAIVEQARRPRLYAELGAPDTIEGRFELYSLHVILLLDRLKRQGDRAAETAQALFDTYVQSLDDALREIGVGDMAVGRKMRKLGEAFYGRVKSYEEALAALPDRAPLEALVGRTVFAGVETQAAASMIDYLLAQREALANNSLEALCDGRVSWGQA
jgi:cytochrome b pre-mRNA-processing protein 3